MKIFLGYPSEHEAAAWDVYRFLSAKGDDVWFDKKSLIAGTDWDAERDRGQREADLIVHLLSEKAANRPGVVHREIRQTLRLVDDQPLGSLFCIPIRLETMKVPIELARFQYFDFNSDWQERLSAGVEKRRTQLSERGSKVVNRLVLQERNVSKARELTIEEIADAYECRGDYIQYDDSNLYWKLVNSSIEAEVLGSYYGNRRDFHGWKLERNVEDDNSQKSEWFCRTEEYFRNEQFVSVRMNYYIHYAGTMHPNRYVKTCNFLGEFGVSPSIFELLAYDDEKALKVLKWCQKVLAAQNDEESDSSDMISAISDNQEDVWKLLAQYGFDKKGLTFNFSQETVLPYAGGVHSIDVPWRFVEDLITSEYADIFKVIQDE